ncbi:MAG: phosphoribosyltransferase [Nitrosopumilaceae archaeon]|nr:phosphoribosyltransferase [Nitrosopumilaceae archaeon]
MNQKEYVNWNEIESLADVLTSKVKSLNLPFNSISTISRGGLVPARLLADRLGIKVILVDKDEIPQDSLFVDDIYDTGKTFAKILPKVKDSDHLIYATLFARKSKIIPKQVVYAQLTKGDEYIVYPWDKFEHGLT